jgi:hypothetical protein
VPNKNRRLLSDRDDVSEPFRNDLSVVRRELGKSKGNLEERRRLLGRALRLARQERENRRASPANNEGPSISLTIGLVTIARELLVGCGQVVGVQQFSLLPPIFGGHSFYGCRSLKSISFEKDSMIVESKSLENLVFGDFSP